MHSILLQNALKGGVKPEHVQGAIVGYLAGVAVMTTVSVVTLHSTFRDLQRREELNKRIIDHVWTYIPSDLKEQVQAEYKFYDIATEEDL